jgi:hypothetical protein
MVSKKNDIAQKENMSGYMLYTIARRKELKLEYPKMKFVDMSIQIGKEWKLLTLDQKKNYGKVNSDSDDY